MGKELEHAKAIWQAGVDSVGPLPLLRRHIRCDERRLEICGREFLSEDLDRVVVIGAGKGGAEMAESFESLLSPEFLDRVSGWINVPANCVKQLQKIHLHPARPAEINKPFPEGVEGTARILELVSELGERDLCVVLLSGGGSALLPAPVEGVSLEDKQNITKLLESAGADIRELNTVRKKLSEVKGGRLAAKIKAKQSIALILSDVVGDPLESIASGPTVPDTASVEDALEIVQRRCSSDAPKSILGHLRRVQTEGGEELEISTDLSNHIIGSNKVALEAAAAKAESLGYQVHSLGSENVGDAHEEGRALVDLALCIRDSGEPVSAPACVLSGGEPTVVLAPEKQRGKGGRNQALVLAGLQRLWEEDAKNILLLSGGTDGEDGPTDAAGAWVGEEELQKARESGHSPETSLSRSDSYNYLRGLNSLLITGATQTNVMDLRVLLIT